MITEAGSSEYEYCSVFLDVNTGTACYPHSVVSVSNTMARRKVKSPRRTIKIKQKDRFARKVETQYVHSKLLNGQVPVGCLPCFCFRRQMECWQDEALCLQSCGPEHARLGFWEFQLLRCVASAVMVWYKVCRIELVYLPLPLMKTARDLEGSRASGVGK